MNTDDQSKDKTDADNAASKNFISLLFFVTGDIKRTAGLFLLKYQGYDRKEIVSAYDSLHMLSVNSGRKTLCSDIIKDEG